MQSVVTALLSWVLLAAISIIISGKLISARLTIGLQDEATFEIPLVIFKLKAKGEEVTTGFIAFILSLIACIFIGGSKAYLLFREQSGVDIGQWNSLCLIAGFLSLLMSTVICITVPLLIGAPIISEKDRLASLKILEGKKSHDH